MKFPGGRGGAGWRFQVSLVPMLEQRIAQNIIGSIFTVFPFFLYMSRIVTKPTKWHMRPAKTQLSVGIHPVSSESSLCAQWVAKDQAFFMRTAKTLIRLSGCLSWPESSLGAHAIVLVLSRCGSYTATSSLDDYEQAYIIQTGFARWRPTSNHVNYCRVL